MKDSIVRLQNLTRRFGQKVALDDVSLDIECGRVFGLLGENGSGKTTLLKHILGLYRPQEGSVSVFGLSPADEPVKVLAQIGFMSEDRSLPNWMTVSDVVRYTAAFYPKWDNGYAKELLETFELAGSAKVKSLSRGQKARVGLLLALAYRPPLLVLDEPSSGLDVVVRREILSAIIRTVADEGRTVIFSSHLLDEVQRVADDFAMLSNGRITWSGQLDETLSSHERITVRLPESLNTPPHISGALSIQGENHEWSLVCNGQLAEVEQQIEKMGGEILDRATPTLEELFVARRGTTMPKTVSMGE